MEGRLTLKVDLYGEGTDTKTGNTMRENSHGEDT